MALPITLDDLLSRVFPDERPPQTVLEDGRVGYCIPLPEADDEDEAWDDEPPTTSTLLPNAVVFFEAEADGSSPEDLLEYINDTLIDLSQLVPELWNARGDASTCRTAWGGAVSLTLYQEDEELWDAHATLLLLSVEGGTALVFLSQQLNYTDEGPTYALHSTPSITAVLGQPLSGRDRVEREVVIRP